MNPEVIRAGFIGTGGIARSHAFALNSLKYYYSDAPAISLEMACSETGKSRTAFASKYGFSAAVSLPEFLSNSETDTVFILGPNKVHATHLQKVLEMKNIKRIYIEKPVCATRDEEELISDLTRSYPAVRIQVGFQYLFMSGIRGALKLWKSGKLGTPFHFEVRYYHGDYLKKEYRDKRSTRLTPAPEGGAMADLGSHALSLAVAFLNDRLRVTGAIQSGSFSDVDPDSDLFSSVSLYDSLTGAAGSVSSSRVASGTGDMLTIELYAAKGTLRFSSLTPEYFEYHTEEEATWIKVPTGSTYEPYTSFPSGHVPPGWLRPMIHAHYVFLSGANSEQVIPDLAHGLAVQRLVRESAENMAVFRSEFHAR
jgi:predicted dehydrogenase